jgi:hypothetical protein
MKTAKQIEEEIDEIEERIEALKSTVGGKVLNALKGRRMHLLWLLGKSLVFGLTLYLFSVYGQLSSVDSYLACVFSMFLGYVTTKVC